MKPLLLSLVLLSGCRNSAPVDEKDSPKRGLGTIRTALSIYYGDMEGQYPQELSALTAGGKYLQALPEVGPQNVHPPSAAVHNGTKPTDAGGWLYVNDAANANAGSVMINCTHRREGVRVARVLTAALLH